MNFKFIYLILIFPFKSITNNIAYATKDAFIVFFIKLDKRPSWGCFVKHVKQPCFLKIFSKNYSI